MNLHPFLLILPYLAFRAVDHQRDGNLFATAGAQVDIWDHNRFELNLFRFFPSSLNYRNFTCHFLLENRSQPVNSFEWGKDTVTSVRFNPGEPNVLATSARYAWHLPVHTLMDE